MNPNFQIRCRAAIKKSRTSALSIAALAIAAIFYLGRFAEKAPLLPPPAQGKATIYPAPKGVELSRAYKVSIAGKAVPVYMANVGDYDMTSRKTRLDTASFASFDM